MKKSVIFLINGLGIEKPGSYSIALDQVMPNLSRTKETSFFTTAVIDSLEYRSAYKSFFLGDTYKLELQYIKENIINDNIINNSTFTKIKEALVNRTTAKLHVFIEPTSERIIENINSLVNYLNLENGREVYLHLIMPHLTVNEYPKLMSIVKYIKFHLNQNMTVGFLIGKEFLSEDLTKVEMDFMKKLLFFCSAERWTDTDKKLLSLQEENIRPCKAPGFCATNSCTIQNGDVVMFFNTNRNNYDNFLKAIYDNCQEAFRTSDYNIDIYSLVKLDTKYNIPSLAENIVYENSLAKMLEEASKKSVIISGDEHISYVNFLANGQNYVNNPRIAFIKQNFEYLSIKENIDTLINNFDKDLIIFDFHIDVSKTINDLKEQLEKIDVVLGNVVDACVNKNSLFISSLYGVSKTLPLANYNSEEVTINYEEQIPIFFFDYSYLRSKYYLAPGETNYILQSAIKCIYDNPKLDSLVRMRGLFNMFK